MQIEVTSNTKALAAVLHELYAGTRKNNGQIVRTETKLTAKALIAITPPAKKGEGTRKVKADILSAIFKVVPGLFKEKWMKLLIKGKHTNTLSIIFSRFKSGPLKGVKHTTDISKTHETARGKRGAVHRRAKARAYTLKATDLNQHIKQKQGNVGMAKGGWAASFIRLAGRPAQWIAKHSDQGKLIDRADSELPHMIIQNNSPWATDRNARNVTNAVLKTRVQRLENAAKHKYDRLFGKLAKTLNTAPKTPVK